MPDSLREVIAARIDALPADTVQLLRTAAVLGRDFDLGLLSAVAHCELESIDATLEAARSTGVTVALDSMRCRFTHALFRELLYEQSSRGQRTALHRAAAVALERRLGHGDDPPMAQLAYHYFEAAQSGTGSEAVIYCRRAGEDALARRAYGEAVQQFERALQITERAHDPDPLARFEILTALGDAQWRSGSVMQAAQTLLKPALIAHRLQWWDRLPQAVLAFQAAQGLIGTAHVASVALHRAALAHTPPTELAVRARLLASLSMAYCYQPDAERSVKTLEDAVRIARELGDPDVLTSCLQKSMWVLNEPAMAANQEAMLQEALAIAQQSGDELELLRSMTGLAFSLLTLGRVAELESLVARLRDCATRARDPHHMNIAAGFSTALAILAGRWAEAARQAIVSVRQAALQDTVGLEGRFGFQMFAIQRARGQLATIAPLLKQITGDSSQRLWLPGQILLHYELGQADEARAALERLDPLTALPRDGLYAISLVYLAEACSGLKDQARCRVLQAALQPFRSINVCLLGTVAFGSGARYLALLAVALRR
ncbi:MAG TPA: hypothetical protein VLT59_08635, partial [Steroidobacteraceae bacterium]|nr:hypothetical protein [Steroidobacteraceae bacterium]